MPSGMLMGARTSKLISTALTIYTCLSSIKQACDASINW